MSPGVGGSRALKRCGVWADRLIATSAVWPGLAGALYFAIPVLLQRAAETANLGRVDLLTVALFVSTLLFAASSAAGLAAAIRHSVSAERLPLSVRLIPSLATVAAFGLTLGLGAHGIIGLRTWAW